MFKLVILLISLDSAYAFQLPYVSKVLVRDPKPLIGVIGRDTLMLECYTKGDVTKILWMFNGTEVISGGQYRFRQSNSILLVDEVQGHNNGQYRCIATNPYGSVFGEKNIQISAIGKFADGFQVTDLKKEKSAVLGEPLTIDCPPHAEGQGQIYYWGDLPAHSIPITWKAGDPVKRAFIGEHGALTFSYLEQSDIDKIQQLGGISCILYQEKVSVQGVRYTIKVKGSPATRNFAPKLKAFMDKEFIVIEGEKQIILCGATGRPHPSISWYKDGKLIYNGETKEKFEEDITFSGEDMELNILKISKSNEGQYKCVANNSEGSDEKEGKMLVHTNPKWLKKLTQGKTLIPYMSPVILHCNASGVPVVTYSWYHNNTKIKSSDRVKIDGGVLTISNSGFVDSGIYMCVARNYLKTIVSPTYVDIQAIPPSFHGEVPNPTYFFINYTNTISCNATAGPAPTKTWYKEGKRIKAVDNYAILNNGTLRIEGTSLADAGKFECVAKNEKGSAERIVNVKVVEKTVITKPPSNVEYKEGHSLVQLFCDATYEKSLHVTYEWLKDGQSINFNKRVFLEKRVSGPSQIISFRELLLGDAGQYSCRVYTADGKNIVSEDTKHGSIGVIARPEAPVDVKVNGNCSTLVNTSISWGASQYFVAPVQDYIIEYAKSSSRYPWYKYDPEHTMSPRTKVTLSKSKLPPSANLKFRVTAISVHNGEKLTSEPSVATSASVCVTPIGPPIVNPANVRSIFTGNKTLVITWDQTNSIHKADGTIVGYRKLSNGTKFINTTISGNENVFKVPNPSTGEQFEVFIRSKNGAGVGPEPKIYVFTSGKIQLPITQMVKNFKIGKVSSSSVVLTWDELTEATGYRIYYWRDYSDSRKRRSPIPIYTRDTNASNSFILSGLSPNSKYKLMITALSGTQEGPQSGTVTFVTAVGVPEVPTHVRVKVMGSALMLSWNAPLLSYLNTVVSYHIEYFETGMGSGSKVTETVSADTRQVYITNGLSSLKYYTVKLAAASIAGKGKSWKLDGIVIGEPDGPGKSEKPHVTSVNQSALNVTFVLPDTYYGGLPDTFKVYYRPEGTNDDKKNVSEVFKKKQWLLLANLQNRPYEIWSAGVNLLGEGVLSAPVVAAPEKVVPIERAQDEPFYKKLWFILLVVLIILLIVFLIFVWLCCTRRGGQYPVDKKEKERGGWCENEPLKDADADIPMDDIQDPATPLKSNGEPIRSVSSNSLQKPPSYKEAVGDEDECSLDDYGEDAKFNEDGSFIGQYGDEAKKPLNV